MTAAEAIAAAAAEGLTLLRANTSSGFRYVAININGTKYLANVYLNDERHKLGSFHTPEEAALRIARWLRDQASTDELSLVDAASVQGAQAGSPSAAGDAPEVASVEASGARHRVKRKAQPPMTAEEALAAASKERLSLELANNASGFRYVYKV